MRLTKSFANHDVTCIQLRQSKSALMLNQLNLYEPRWGSINTHPNRVDIVLLIRIGTISGQIIILFQNLDFYYFK